MLSLFEKIILGLLIIILFSIPSFSIASNEQIDRQRVYDFVRSSMVVSEGLGELDAILNGTDFIQGRSLSIFDAIQTYLIAVDIVRDLNNVDIVRDLKNDDFDDWQRLLVKASKYTTYTVMSSTTMGKVLGSSWTIASLASLPIELGIENIVEAFEKGCYERQVGLYFLAREEGYSNNFILAGKTDGLIGFSTLGGEPWITHIDSKNILGRVTKGLNCGATLSDLSAEQVFIVAGELYEILSDSELGGKLRKDKLSLTERLSNVLSEADNLLTNCGSKWYQRFGLQLLEIEQGLRGRYTFDSVCGSHDKCYDDCVTSRDECDNNLLTNAQNICSQVVRGDKDACESDAKSFYTKVNDKGQDAFVKARQSCATSDSTLPVQLTPPNQIENKTQSKGIAIALILDRSGSMKEAQKLEKAKQASKAFILAMDDTDDVSISSFSGEGSTQQEMKQVAQVKSILDIKLSEIKASGATNLGAGLKHGFQQLSKSKGLLKTALLLSDGENNRDEWEPIVEDYHKQRWPVCTIGFGKITKKAEVALLKIATDTGCTYVAADTFDVVAKYQQLSAYVKGDSSILAVSDMLSIKGNNIYNFIVTAGSKLINGFTNWFGSELKTILIDPSGKRIDVSKLTQSEGRYILGKDFQNFEIKDPQPGKWKFETSWAIAPKVPEQVNILVTEKSDIFSQILSFRPHYKKREPVTINVIVTKLVDLKKTPLGQVSVKVQIQKPGEQMVRMVEAQSTNWTMYKDVVIDVTRDLELFDDGQHDDYKAGDGIFGNTFTETDKQGSYLVAATVNGQKHNGQSVEKKMLASFQVGPITQNRVSNTQTLQYMGKAQGITLDKTSSYSNELLGDPLPELHNMESEDPLLDFQDLDTGDPLEDIERMQGSDPMDEINQMLRSQ